MTVLTHVYYNKTRNKTKISIWHLLLNDRNLNIKLNLPLHVIDHYLYQSLVMQLKKSVNIITNKYIYAVEKAHVYLHHF